MKAFRLWFPVVLWMCIIFLLSSRERIQVSHQESINFIVFKTLHMAEYAMLFLLYFRAVKYTFITKPEATWYLAAYILTLCFAASDEIHQTFVPTRGGMARDVIIDAIGTLGAWITIKLLSQKAPKKLQKLVKIWQLL